VTLLVGGVPPIGTEEKRKMILSSYKLLVTVGAAAPQGKVGMIKQPLPELDVSLRNGRISLACRKAT
jgi:hypothetical protein